MRIIGTLGMIAALVAGIAAQAEHDAQKQSLPPHVERPKAGVTIGTSIEAEWASDLSEIDEWVRGVREREWAEGVWAEGVERARLERVAAEAAARAARPRVAAPARGPGGTVGECSGFVIPDYIIQRESGGNPSAYNPSGAYGCAQTLLSHYSSGSCRGLDPYTIEGQRECVNILSNGGSNLQPWAATR